MINESAFVNGPNLEQQLAVTDIAPEEMLRPVIRPGGILHPGPHISIPHQTPPTPAPTSPQPAPAQTQPAPAPTPPSPTPAPPPAVPAAPQSNPFDSLPFPSPGDRVKSDDFKTLSQALKIISDMARLSGSLVGHPFGDVKGALVSQGYQIFRVMTVFGAEIDNLGDASLDTRKVIQVMPVDLGSRGVLVVVTEAVDTRRFVPNLIGLTYHDAQERIHALVGDVAPGGAPPSAPHLVGLTLDQAQQALNQ